MLLLLILMLLVSTATVAEIWVRERFHMSIAGILIFTTVIAILISNVSLQDISAYPIIAIRLPMVAAACCAPLAWVFVLCWAFSRLRIDR